MWKSWLLAGLLFAGIPAFAQSVYTNNFDSLSTGSNATGWTCKQTGVCTVQATNPVSSPNTLGNTVHDTENLYTTTAVTDGEILFDQKVLSTSGGANSGVVLRSDILALTQYVVVLNYSGGLTIQIYAVNAGPGSGSLVSSVSSGLALTSGDTLHSRVQIQGSTIRGRYWINGNAEPGTWTITGTDGTYSLPGYFGLYAGFYGSSAGATATADNFSLTNLAVSLSASPSAITTGSTGNVITLTGIGTAWTSGTPGSPTFSLSGGTGASITGQSVASTTSATITVTAGSTAATLTITDPSTGATTPITVSSTSTVNDSHWFFSPYVTYSDGGGSLQTNNIHASSTYARWVSPGAYFKYQCSSCTTATVNMITPTLSGSDEIWVKYSVDGGAWTNTQLSSAQASLVMFTGLSSGTHGVEFRLRSSNYNSDRWTPTEYLKLTSISTDGTSATPTGFIAIRSKNCYLLGESIAEGHHTESNSGSQASNSDSQHSLFYSLPETLNCEYGHNAHGGQGYQTTASDSTPQMSTSWAFYSSGLSNLVSGKLSPIPDYVFAYEGSNDSSSVASTVASWIPNVRAAVNTSTPVWLVIPFTQYQLANITSGVTTAADTYAKILDLGVRASYGVNTTFTGATWRSWDGVHLDSWTSLTYGGWIAQLATAGSSGAIVQITIGRF